MDIDNNNQNEQTTLLNKLIYAIDEHGMKANLFIFIINKFYYRNWSSVRQWNLR